MSEMTRYLIVNADDCGLTKEVSRGILTAHQEGIVSSVSVMANMPDFQESMDQIKRFPDLDCGVHLNLTIGSPITSPEEIGSLTDMNGKFYGLFRFLARLKTGRVKLCEVKSEWETQVVRLQEEGIRISHLDSHHHVHAMPELCSVAFDLAEKHKVPVVRNPREFGLRVRGIPFLQFLRSIGIFLLISSNHSHRYVISADFFSGFFADRLMKNPSAWRQEVAKIPEGVTEIAVHPGYDSEALRQFELPRVASRREKELALLTQPQLKVLLQETGIKIISHAQYRSLHSTNQPQPGRGT